MTDYFEADELSQEIIESRSVVVVTIFMENHLMEVFFRSLAFSGLYSSVEVLDACPKACDPVIC